jgi:hypothetical protein
MMNKLPEVKIAVGFDAKKTQAGFNGAEAVRLGVISRGYGKIDLAWPARTRRQVDAASTAHRKVRKNAIRFTLDPQIAKGFGRIGEAHGLAVAVPGKMLQQNLTDDPIIFHEQNMHSAE